MNNFKKTISWYNKNADSYSAKIKFKINIKDIKYFLGLISKFKEGEQNKDINILDAGCATGRDCKIFTDLECKVTGVDISKELIDLARKENEKHFDIDFVEADVCSLPFEDNLFDGVWASASLVHLESKKQLKDAMEELCRVLKKDGVLFVSLQNREGLDEGWVKDEHSDEGRFFSFFKQGDLEEIASELGLEVVEVFERNSSRVGIRWLFSYFRKI